MCKLDPSVTEYALPYFMGLFSAILEIDIYKEIKKDGAILDNYKVLAMQMATDENGVPTMSFEKLNSITTMLLRIYLKALDLSCRHLRWMILA